MLSLGIDLWSAAAGEDLAAGGPPAWVLRPGGAIPLIDIDFANGLYYGTSAGAITATRSTAGWAPNAAGVYTQFAANTVRSTDLGLWVEDVRTNIVLWSRDLTNAAWVKVTATAVLNQTGVDGVANSASSLTATAANATVLQTITSASSARFQTAFVKRLSGSGTVNMTLDGTTWTAVTVTASWARVAIPTQAVTNPIVGFQIATSGDSIAVDIVQNEATTFASSPIVTTAAAVQRTADNIYLPALSGLTNCTLFAAFTPQAPAGTASAIIALSDGTIANRLLINRNAANTGGVITVASAGQTSPTAAVLPAQNARSKAAMSVTSGRAAISVNGGAAVSSAPASIPSAANLSTLQFGNRGDGLVQLYGIIDRVTVFSTALSDANLQSIST